MAKNFCRLGQKKQVRAVANTDPSAPLPLCLEMIWPDYPRRGGNGV